MPFFIINFFSNYIIENYFAINNKKFYILKAEFIPITINYGFNIQNMLII